VRTRGTREEAHLIYDLHTHSNASDGILTPEALVRRAQARGVQVLALTDHDTLAGQAEAAHWGQALGVQLIAGIEFSTQWAGRSIHLVGLGFDPAAASIADGVQRQVALRQSRAQTIAERLAKAGIPNALAGAQAIAGEAILGRPHFAQYLVAQGHVPNAAAAFKKYLGAGKPGDVKSLWPELAEAVHWITAAGGIAVLAHPDKYTLTRSKLKSLLGEFKEAGGQAMEVISGKQLPAVTDKLARLAREMSLMASCGSDFHVPNQPWQELGAFGTLPPLCTPVWQAFTGHASAVH
jgi:3',5'-nucleoside bisphosphate phosphatase